MNILLHFSINYPLIKTVFPEAENYKLVLFSSLVVLDLDHLPLWLKNSKEILKEKKLGAESRSVFHELIGLCLLSFFCLLAYFIFKNKILIQILALNLILHLALDMLTGYSRPYFPLSRQELDFSFAKGKKRIVLETILTIFFIGGLYFFW